MKAKYAAPYLNSEVISKNDIFAASGEANSSSSVQGLDKLANGSNKDNFMVFWNN